MTPDAYLRAVGRAAQGVRRRVPGASAGVAVVLGSGLADAVPRLKGARSVPYAEIPGFPRATVKGHKGTLTLGRRGKARVAVLQGRLHYYEGHPMSGVVFPLHVLKRLGVKTLVLTSAVGSLTPKLKPGSLVALSDHINLMGANPLRGLVGPEFGEMFPDMSRAYDPGLRGLAREVGRKVRVPVREGVYVAVAGPSYETPAEIRAFRRLGADVVGMSVAPEVIAARQMGMRLLALSWVANLASGVLDRDNLSHAEVLAEGRRTASRIRLLLESLLDRIST